MLIIRRLYSRQLRPAKYIQRIKADPGISKQKKIFAETHEDINEADFDELESDFMSVHQTHKEHVVQMEAWKEKEKYFIVKQKYFKERFPNFLTWHDKEQIRYLHSSDPDEWSIERLSESFPALPDIIQKIVKTNWTKKNRQKMAAHDKMVERHWKDFKQGKLNNLPEELKGHLHKFSDRSVNLKSFQNLDDAEKKVQNLDENKKPGEFSEIIASYERLKSNKDKQNQDLKTDSSNMLDNNTNEIVSLDDKVSKKDKRLLTFKELQHRVQRDIKQGKNISEQEKLIAKENTLPTKEDFDTTVLLKPEEISKIVEHRHQTNSNKVGFVRKTTRDMSHLIYPDKIVIPNNLYKKGYTYKLNDCYYDSDGEFLYRVPGMS